MREFKRSLSLFLAIVMLISLFSCGEFKPAQGGGAGQRPGGSTNDPQLDNDPTNDFVVQLRLGDKPFVPTTNVDVYWNDGYNIFVATVDGTGKATVDGLDGDYHVTLSGVPAGYAYDPNSYVATNDNRTIIIDMYELNMLRGVGTGLYDCISISNTGVYTVTLTSPEDVIYVEFSPRINGVYTVESWANIIDNEINPICVAYYGHSQHKYDPHKVTKTGLCGSYTRNFIHEVNIADENISVSGGSQSFTFALSAESKIGEYPVKLTFAVKRNGGFDTKRAEIKLMLPTQDFSHFDFEAFNALAGGKFVNAEVPYGSSGVYVFDESNYKVWPISQGGDGVYHVYDLEKYPETDGYGPVLVAHIADAFRFSPVNRDGESLSFVNLDKESNALIVGGKYNYRLFIRGIKALEGEYCVAQCRCRLEDDHVVCPVGCTRCKPECIQATPEEMSAVGYAEYANSDGVVPVTPELKEFLQRYVSNSGYYFADGDGRLEKEYGIHSDEESQWLFACGYYE